ncbi:MAG TPA: Ku protein [Thermoleophilaceae bacterium]|nr:Ku protein [Thermoleophilaceae bacterium]
MPPKSIWNGTIAFGAVAVPIKLFSATESKAVHFHELHRSDEARIEHRRFCSKEDREVDYDEVVKGYEVSEGEYVVLTKEEVAAADPSRGKVVELEDFVAAAEIDPVLYDRAYYVGAQKDGEAAYRLLHAALERTERVGIGRFVFHNKEQLVALRTFGDVLALHTMRFHDEVVAGEDVELPSPQKKPSKREVGMAGTLVSSLEAKFKPDRYEDTYRASAEKLIAKKARGEEIELPDDHPDDLHPDMLMAALEASLGKKKAA